MLGRLDGDEFFEKVCQRNVRRCNRIVDCVIVFLELRAHLADILFQDTAVGLRETAEGWLPGFLEGAAGNGSVVNHEDLLSLGDGIGYDV